MHTTILGKFNWFDENNKIVNVSEIFDGKVILTALADLNNNTVNNIEVKYELLSENVTKIFNEHSNPSRILENARNWAKQQHPPYPRDIAWHEDGTKFGTLKESYEWVYSVIYNEIGNQYNGYQTLDEKIAYSLVYELTKLNTFNNPKFKVFAHEELDSLTNQIQYRIWVERITK